VFGLIDRPLGEKKAMTDREVFTILRSGMGPNPSITTIPVIRTHNGGVPFPEKIPLEKKKG